jgi:hypothetical protein
LNSAPVVTIAGGYTESEITKVMITDVKQNAVGSAQVMLEVDKSYAANGGTKGYEGTIPYGPEHQQP